MADLSSIGNFHFSPAGESQKFLFAGQNKFAVVRKRFRRMDDTYTYIF